MLKPQSGTSLQAQSWYTKMLHVREHPPVFFDVGVGATTNPRQLNRLEGVWLMQNRVLIASMNR